MQPTQAHRSTVRLFAVRKRARVLAQTRIVAPVIAQE
jgi:hypothetical protein